MPDDTPVEISSKKARALLAYLAISGGGAHSREHLATLLWDRSGDAHARASLRQALRALKSALGDAEAKIEASADAVQLDHRFINTDVGRILAGGGWDASVLPASGALRVLNGFSGMAEPFEEWRRGVELQVRASLQARASEMLDDARGRDAHFDAIRWAVVLISLDPLNEDAYAAKMNAELADGRPSAALATFQACEAELRRQLDCGPNETLAQAAKRARLLLSKTRATDNANAPVAPVENVDAERAQAAAPSSNIKTAPLAQHSWSLLRARRSATGHRHRRVGAYLAFAAPAWPEHKPRQRRSCGRPRSAQYPN